MAKRLNHWLADWAPALPVLVVAFCLLIAPVIALVVESFRANEGGFTLAHWLGVLGGKSGQRAILTSLGVSAVCATLSLLVGAPLAWLISRMATFPRATWLAVLNLAANFGGIGLAFAFIATMGTYGMVTLALQSLSLPLAMPAPNSFAGLVIAFEYTNLPLFVLLSLPAMGILRNEWWEAAQTAAATGWQFWRMVGIPVLTPFLAAGWLLIFTWTMGLYGLPFALGAGSPASPIRLITTEIGDVLQASFTGPQRAAVLGVILLLLASISLLTYRSLLRRALQWF